MLTSILTVFVNEPLKKITRQEKKNFDNFFIFPKSGVKILLKWALILTIVLKTLVNKTHLYIFISSTNIFISSTNMLGFVFVTIVN